jgi:hypothetical protein
MNNEDIKPITFKLDGVQKNINTVMNTLIDNHKCCACNGYGFGFSDVRGKLKKHTCGVCEGKGFL